MVHYEHFVFFRQITNSKLENKNCRSEFNFTFLVGKILGFDVVNNKFVQVKFF